MPQTTTTNRRIVLAEHPTGELNANTFRLEQTAIPQPAEGQMLLRTLWLSLDPYMRVRINAGPGYRDPVAMGATMIGGTISQVVESRHPDYRAGDLVIGYSGWQDYALSDGSNIDIKLDPAMAHPSWGLGVLGMPGFTAWHGLMNIGEPKAGETFVTAAATGAVGQIAGQLAKARGLRTVGIAGGADKCRYAVEALGFDACVDHRAADLPGELQKACPGGIDIYFENVGGAVFDAVLPLMNAHSRMPVCGLIAHYNGGGASGDRLPLMFATLLKRLKMQGFIIYDHYPSHYADFFKTMSGLLAQGAIQVREDVIDSLEEAPQGLVSLLAGRNFGKVVVKVA